MIIVDAICLGCSEGVQMEYVAFFYALLFPGALVAFNHTSLQALPSVASLRIYCAGIWHNAAVRAHTILLSKIDSLYNVGSMCSLMLKHNYLFLQFCGVCTMALSLLPIILSPFYMHGENPMV